MNKKKSDLTHCSQVAFSISPMLDLDLQLA
jgi:hypothetical protein